MTAGDEIEQKFTFPALVETQIQGYKAINQSRSGWPTDTYIKKWEEVEDDFPSNAEIVFVQLGVNDLSKWGHNDSTITICTNNMEIILKRLRGHYPEAEIVLMSSVKMNVEAMDKKTKDAGFNSMTNSFLSRIGEGYSIIAMNSNCNFIDLHRLVPMKSTYDGVHLNKVGHKIVADVIIRFMNELSMSKQDQNIY